MFPWLWCRSKCLKNWSHSDIRLYHSVRLTDIYLITPKWCCYKVILHEIVHPFHHVCVRILWLGYRNGKLFAITKAINMLCKFTVTRILCNHLFAEIDIAIIRTGTICSLDRIFRLIVIKYRKKYTSRVRQYLALRSKFYSNKGVKIA